jgi:putative DNA primase/helicase
VVSHYIACQNGLLDLGPILSGESDLPVLYEFSPRHFSSVQLGFEFDPDATCPEYDKFIQEVLPALKAGDRRVERLEQFAGWALSNSALRLEKAAVLVGNGANGKSTFLNMLTELLGAGNVSHVALEDFGQRFRPQQMMGKLANISNDMNRVERFEEGVFKQLVSGDRVQFERKNMDPVTCYCHARLIFATNHLPAINDRTTGTFRRLLVIPFKESFCEAKADKHLDTKLAQELAGVANRLFRALASLVRDGHFAECSICAAAEATYRIDTDPFLQFFEEHCKLDKLAATKCSELYRHYTAYCRDNGRHPVHSTEFARRVEEKTQMPMKRPGSKGPRQRVLPGVRYVDHVQRE